MAENSRARVFVLFLDFNHVDVEGSLFIREPLVDALNRLIGPDDLIGVMTPEMSAADVTFARRTTHDRRHPLTLPVLGRARPGDSAGSRGRDVRTLLSRFRPTPDCTDDDRRGRRVDSASSRETDARRAGRSRRVPAWRPRGTQGDPCHFRRLAALQPESRSHAAAQLSDAPGARGYRPPNRKAPTTTAPIRQPTPNQCEADRVDARRDRQRRPISRSARPGERGERLFLSGRSARPRSLRHVDRGASRARAPAPPITPPSVDRQLLNRGPTRCALSRWPPTASPSSAPTTSTPD